jgi:hypothetical protein
MVSHWVAGILRRHGTGSVMDLSLSIWEPPNVYGPMVSVVMGQITAVVDDWDAPMRKWRATVHLVGGEKLRVCQSRGFIVDELNKWNKQK